MKFAHLAALMGAASATTITAGSLEGNMVYMQQEQKIDNALQKTDIDADNHLAQLLTTALAGAPEGEIIEPKALATTKEGELTTTNGRDYTNYQYFWKFVCAFTKWVPTNQFLFAGKKYDESIMTLERFGFIGTEKKCFWGMVGVKWITPLKVEQIKPK